MAGYVRITGVKIGEKSNSNEGISEGKEFDMLQLFLDGSEKSRTYSTPMACNVSSEQHDVEPGQLYYGLTVIQGACEKHIQNVLTKDEIVAVYAASDYVEVSYDWGAAFILRPFS